MFTEREEIIALYFAVASNRRRAVGAAVGEQALVALSAVLCVLLHHVLVPQQGVFAVMAVKALGGRHVASSLSAACSEKR